MQHVDDDRDGCQRLEPTAFAATAFANPVVGVCAVTVTDNLTDQRNALPTFKVTYRTSSVNGRSKIRK